MVDGSHRDDIEDYYARRAGEYDRVYDLLERQADLRQLRDVLLDFATGRRLLEIACGTGYWTGVVAGVATSVLATDTVEEVLEVARGRGLSPVRVTFARADAFALDALPGDFDAAFAGFWWSHVRRADLPGFLARLHRRLGPGAGALFFDNVFVAGSSTPISRIDKTGDTYQERVLQGGTRHEILKNYPTAEQVRQQLVDAGGRAVQVETLEHYWHAKYEVGGAAQP